MKTRLQRLFTAGALLSSVLGSVQALSVPMSGWSASTPAQDTWNSDNGACVLQEMRLSQAFTSFQDAEAARKFALRIQQALMAQKLDAVVTQPVDRAGRWTVLAAYLFTKDGVQYRATQLYLSDAGKLRTVTGSTANGEASDCVAQMHDFLRYLAN
ncbi:hypothetical protein [Deinococcus sonorensis]|uniref:Uncharacterized protein n=2 Tax=Deinococcus sonorensis TaxID=309891 RepID=A0AAU7U8T6_9DEIO